MRKVINASVVLDLHIDERMARIRTDLSDGPHESRCARCGSEKTTDMRQEKVRHERAHALGCAMQGGAVRHAAGRE